MKKQFLALLILSVLLLQIPDYVFGAENIPRRILLKTKSTDPKRRPLNTTHHGNLGCIVVEYYEGVLSYNLTLQEGISTLSVTDTETMELQEWTVDTSAPVSVFIGEPSGDVEITLTTQQNTYTGTMYIY